MGFKHDVAAGTVSGVVSGAIVSIAVFVGAVAYGDWAAEQFSPATCARPDKLEAIPVKSASAESEIDREAADAVDGYLGSLWVPPLDRSANASSDPSVKHAPRFVPSEDERTLELTLEQRSDIALVCVNNAMASSRFTFEQWGKVQTVAYWTDADDEKVFATMVAMPDSEWQVSQGIARDLNDVRILYIRVDSALSGATTETFDPDHCAPPEGDPRVANERVDLGGGERAQLRFERGCIMAPSPQAGLSEVVVYRQSS